MNAIETDPEIKKNLEDCFQKWKKISEDLNKNIAQGLRDELYGTDYSLIQHLENELNAVGFNKDFEEVVSTNEIDVCFAILFFSGKADEVAKKVTNLLEDQKIVQEAQKICLERIENNLKEDEESIKNIDSIVTQTAFYKLKQNFIDNQNFNDAVYTLIEIELLFKAQHPQEVNHKFFSFIKTLFESDFFRRGKEVVCNKDFYMQFKDYFTSIDLIVAQVNSILAAVPLAQPK